MDVWAWILVNGWVWVALFYLGLVILIYHFRKKFEFQAKFIAMYRTKFGLKLIDKIGKKHSEIIKIIGYCGIGIGFIGMALILIVIGKGLVDLMMFYLGFVSVEPAPVIAPVIPGVEIPGTGFKIPFIQGILALFIVIVIHEFSHGIVARAHNVKIKSTGIFFMGPIIGAFVEPDEKDEEKQSDVVKYSIFAAGPASNVYTAAIVLFITMLIITPLIDYSRGPQLGIKFTSIDKGFPADQAGLEVDKVYTILNGNIVRNVSDFEKIFETVKVNDTITISNSVSDYAVMTTSRNATPERAVIGVNIATAYLNDNTWWMLSTVWINELIFLIFILSIGLGLANLLPIGPVDGGRMIKEALEKIRGGKKGSKVWVKVTVIMLIILFILLIPVIKATLLAGYHALFG
jgi:membrane-associated protease RseP (regulator of RpoE activity)